MAMAAGPGLDNQAGWPWELGQTPRRFLRVEIGPQDAAVREQVRPSAAVPAARQHADVHVRALGFFRDLSLDGGEVPNGMEPLLHSLLRANAQLDQRAPILGAEDGDQVAV